LILKVKKNEHAQEGGEEEEMEEVGTRGGRIRIAVDRRRVRRIGIHWRRCFKDNK